MQLITLGHYETETARCVIDIGSEVLFALPSIPFFAMVVWEHISQLHPSLKGPLHVLS